MTSATEQFSALGKSQVDAALRIAAIVAAGSEKLFDLQIKNTRSVFDDGVKTAKALAEVKDISQLSGFTPATPQAGIESLTNYARSVYEVAAGTQAEINAVVEAQLAEFGKGFTTAVEAALASAPAGSESAVSAVKTALGTANSMYEGFAKATKQLTSLAEANVAAATSAPAGGKKKAA
jgi:phasin family protein